MSSFIYHSLVPIGKSNSTTLVAFDFTSLLAIIAANRMSQHIDSVHENVQVVIFRWEKDDNQAATIRQTGILKEFFRKNFHYSNVQIVEIPRCWSKRKVDTVLSNVEQTCVAENAALIVGYFGHGEFVGPEEYRIFPRASFNVSINWVHIQKRLQAMNIDVLILVDSCYAASLAVIQSKTPSTNRTEMIVAWGYDEKTFPSGKLGGLPRLRSRGFIAALVDCLKEYKKHRDSFTVSNIHRELVRNIVKYKYYNRTSTDEVTPTRTPSYINLGDDHTLNSITFKKTTPLPYP